nr:phospholipase-like protein [Tanacetum cinerariifolium]
MLLRWLCGFSCLVTAGFYLFAALLVLYKMNMDNYEEPRVLVTCRSREEFCLVTGLRFRVEYWVDYNNDDDPIPFRRRMFSSAKDGILQFVLLGFEDRRRVPDWILKLANDIDGWDKYPKGSYVWPTLYSQLRDANVRRCPSLYATEPRRDVDKKTYSIFGFTWAFKACHNLVYNI